MKEKYLQFILLFLLVYNNSIAGDKWTQMASCQGPARTSNVNFTIDGKLYIALGYSETTSTRFNDLWEYDPIINLWSKKANFPGSARYGAISFVINGKAYVGTGSEGGGIQLADFYEYNPRNNTWLQKANFSGGRRDNATGFSIGNKGYLSCGYSSNSGSLKNDLWEYNPILDTWTSKANLPGAIRNAPMSFEMNGEGYVGWGYNGNGLTNDVFKYNQSLNNWSRVSKTDFAPLFVFCNNNNLYICSDDNPKSIDSRTSTIKIFNSENNTWNYNSKFRGLKRITNPGVEINGYNYIYGGSPIGGTETYSSVWRFSPNFSNEESIYNDIKSLIKNCCFWEHVDSKIYASLIFESDFIVKIKYKYQKDNLSIPQTVIEREHKENSKHAYYSCTQEAEPASESYYDDDIWGNEYDGSWEVVDYNKICFLTKEKKVIIWELSNDNKTLSVSNNFIYNKVVINK